MKRKAKSTLSENFEIPTALEHDAIDQLMFDSISHARKIVELCEDEVTTGLVQDSFTSFFSRNPKMREENAPRIQKELLETMMALPEYQSLTDSTSDDEICSALGATNFAPEMIRQYRLIEKKVQEHKKNNPDQDGDQDGDGKGEGPGLGDLLSDQEMAGLRQKMRQALEKGQKDADDWTDTVQGWGLDKGELQAMPAEKRMQLADQLMKSDQLARIAELAGRFKNIVNAKSASVPVHGNDEIVDIHISDDLAHMLPTEYVKMIEQPELFIADYVDKKLLTYELKGTEEVGKGPIIACLDISGSMQGPREEWAKAVVLALLRLAEKQKRAFGFMAFESCVRVKKFFPKNHKITIQEKMDIAGVSTTGGTSFYEPIKEAFRMRAQEASLKPADIIFITDGDCYLSDTQLAEIVEEKEKSEVRIYSIAIEGSGDTLQPWSDQVSHVSMSGDVTVDVVKDLIGSAASGASKK